MVELYGDIPEDRLPQIRARLKSARELRRLSQKAAAAAINTALQRLGGEWQRTGKVPADWKAPYADQTTIRRWEGSDRSRPNTSVSFAVVHAAAQAYEIALDVLLAPERVPEPGTPEAAEQLERDEESYWERWSRQRFNHPEDPAVESLLWKQTALRRILYAGLGVEPRSANGKPVPEITANIEWLIEELERLFLDATAHVPLTDVQFIYIARAFVTAFAVPAKLPSAFFRSTPSLDEQTFRDFWHLQLTAVRMLIRPAVGHASKDRFDRVLKRKRSEQWTAPRQQIPWEQTAVAWQAQEERQLHASAGVNWQAVLRDAQYDLDTSRTVLGLMPSPQPERLPNVPPYSAERND